MPKFYFNADPEETGGNGGTTLDVEKLIAEKIAEEKAKWETEQKSKLNEAEKGIRLRLEKEAEKAKMTAEEKAKAEYEERFNQTTAERDTYKNKYRDMLVRDKLNQAGLPVELYIDNKRLDVEDDKLDEVIKGLKKSHDTIIGGKTSPSTTPKTTGNEQINMTIEDMAKLAETNPALYRELRKKQLYGGK